MDTIIIAVSATVVLVAAAVHLIVGPFSIGKKGHITPTSYITSGAIYVCAIILAGRALGWW